MIRKPMSVEQMKPFLMQNANDLTVKHGPNNVSNNFIDIANYIEQQEQAHNALREKLKEIEWSVQQISGDYCPSCENDIKNGHAKDCWLNAELQAIKEDSR